ncbi:unnamed protein product, partial [Owenia fusiformis]
CENRDGGLVSVLSQAEQNFVQSHVASGWLGLNYSDPRWTWSDGSYYHYSNWHQEQGSGSCACMLGSKEEYKWRKFPCSDLNSYFCKKNADKDECYNSPCGHGGTCVDIIPGFFC